MKRIDKAHPMESTKRTLIRSILAKIAAHTTEDSGLRVRWLRALDKMPADLLRAIVDDLEEVTV